ncbi:GroES-like protein [Lophiostoma macrostomum CBS 122681]|uniref:GroES-like protein n=1 Tax=Lophiostoma macrostomum CBS 122681 TaxID=1314788 RepID=A0A6A6SI78_9PLEO|nr:GroES-like protein [Lophiostoma macrostomum CBS 122681]
MANLAALLTAVNTPLEIQEVEKWTPDPTEILVKNEVIAFNPIEWKLAKLGIYPLHFPAILGSTIGGTIEAVGSEVKGYEVGDKVVASKKFGQKFGADGNRFGAYQRYVVVGDVMISKLPTGLDPAVPASIMMNLTCVVGLFTGRLGLERPPLNGSKAAKKSEKILIYGGSSSFGTLSIQYLSQAGYSVTTTSSPKNKDFVSKLGAATVIDHTGQSEALSKELIAKGPYDIVVDMISLPNTIPILAGVLAAQDGGNSLYAMQPAFGPETLPKGVTRVFEPWSDPLYEDGNQHLLEWVIKTYLPQGLANGVINPVPVERVAGGLSGVNGALDRMQKGVSGRRLVAYPWER